MPGTGSLANYPGLVMLWILEKNLQSIGVLNLLLEMPGRESET